jgi:hypothetical protein
MRHLAPGDVRVVAVTVPAIYPPKNGAVARNSLLRWLQQPRAQRPARVARPTNGEAEVECTTRRGSTNKPQLELSMVRWWWSGVALGVVVAGCHHSVQINPSPAIPMASRWTGTLASPPALRGAVEIHGSAWMAPPSGSDTTRALINIQIANASPGGVHPWGVHSGSCGNDQGVFGSDNAYPPLKVNSDGQASARVQQTIPPPKTGSYFVEVLASRDNAGLVIACGNLAAPQG